MGTRDRGVHEAGWLLAGCVGGLLAVWTLLGWMAGWLAGWLDAGCWLSGWLAGGLAGWMASHSRHGLDRIAETRPIAVPRT